MAKFDLQPIESPRFDLQPVPKSLLTKIPGTVDYSTSEEPMMFRAAPPVGELEAWKGALFPTKEGYGGGRWTKPTRAEKLYRGLTFAPSAIFRGVGSAVERLNVAATGVVKPLFATIGHGKLEEIETGELKKYPKSVYKGLEAAFRKPGLPREAPTFGEMLSKDWYSPLVGKEPPAAYTSIMDVAFDTTILFGPKALRQHQITKARKEFFTKVNKITTKYDSAVAAAKAKGDPQLAKTVKRLRAAEQTELAPLVTNMTPEEISLGKARLEPTKFQEAWKTVSGKELKAGETIAEASLKVEPPAQKLTRLMKAAKRIQPQYEKIKHAELQRRAAAITNARQQYKGKEAMIKSLQATKGRIDAPEFTPPGLSMSTAEKAALHDQLRLSKKLLPFDYEQATQGLESLLAGYKPYPSQIELLEREFGPELVKSILRLTTKFPQKLTAGALDVANLPRTLLTAYDLSASLRQGYIAGLRHPALWSKAFGAQVKALFSERNALAIENSIRTSRYWPDALKYKLYQPSVTGVSGALAGRPEEFMSRFARVVPGVEASERAFITFGNKIRMDLFSKTMNAWKGTGKTAKDYKLLGKYINALTGRGELPLKFLEQNGAAVNALFFSPRWVSSRIQLAGRAAKALPWAATGGVAPAHAVSKMAAADMVTFVGVNTSMLAAIKFYWGDKVDVELDPRSSDFGKVRVGNSRWEAFAGYQPLARYTAQAMAGERKQALTGRMFQTTPEDVGKRFVRSKLSPIAGFVVDLYTGTTFIGDEMTTTRLWRDPPEKGWTPSEKRRMPWQKQVGTITEGILFKRFFPMAGQDILDAAAFQGAGEAAAMTPAVILGFGGGTWPPSKGQQLALLQDGESRKRLGKSWEDTGPMSQLIMRNINTDWAELEKAIKYDRQKRGVTEVSKREQSAAGKSVHKQLSPQTKQYMKEVKVSIGGLSRTLSWQGIEWRLNDERYEKYQNLIAENISDVAFKWGGKPDRLILENTIKMAKEFARNEIILEANVEDE